MAEQDPKLAGRRPLVAQQTEGSVAGTAARDVAMQAEITATLAKTEGTAQGVKLARIGERIAKYIELREAGRLTITP